MVVHDCVWRGGHVRLHGGSWLCEVRGGRDHSFPLSHDLDSNWRAGRFG